MKILDKENKIVKESDLRAPLLRQLGRKISMPIVYFLDKYTNITPNQITFFMALLGFLNAYLFFEGSYLFLVFGGILLWIRHIFDFVDGSLARFKDISSDLGYWYDHHTDEFGKALIFIGMTLGVYYQTFDYRVFIFGLIVIVAYLYSSLTYQMFMRFPFAKKTVELGKGKHKFLMQLVPADPLLIIFMSVAAFTNQIYLFLIIMSFYIGLFAIVQFFMMSIKLKKNNQKRQD